MKFAISFPRPKRADIAIAAVIYTGTMVYTGLEGDTSSMLVSLALAVVHAFYWLHLYLKGKTDV